MASDCLPRVWVGHDSTHLVPASLLALLLSKLITFDQAAFPPRRTLTNCTALRPDLYLYRYPFCFTITSASFASDILRSIHVTRSPIYYVE